MQRYKNNLKNCGLGRRALGLCSVGTAWHLGTASDAVALIHFLILQASTEMESCNGKRIPISGKTAILRARACNRQKPATPRRVAHYRFYETNIFTQAHAQAKKYMASICDAIIAKFNQILLSVCVNVR